MWNLSWPTITRASELLPRRRCAPRFSAVGCTSRAILDIVTSGQRSMVTAKLRTIRAGHPRSREKWRKVADGLRKRFPKLAILMDAAEHDVLAHRADRLNHSRRASQCRDQSADQCRWHPSERAAIVRLVCAILLEQNDEWSVQRRYMPLETMKPSGNTDFES